MYNSSFNCFYKNKLEIVRYLNINIIKVKKLSFFFIIPYEKRLLAAELGVDTTFRATAPNVNGCTMCGGVKKVFRQIGKKFTIKTKHLSPIIL